MFNLKELYRLKRLIDFSVNSDDPDVLIIQDKITDMITLRKAWGKHKKEDCY